jgi:S-DNA-T family DNA segregation ATPase FtsK/SpoIIIE
VSQYGVVQPLAGSSRLKQTRPEFLGLFVVIGRVRRNLGMYLLLASQRLDEGGTT